jgi:hypothetical protein
MDQIHHTWTPPSTNLPNYPFSDSWNSFNRYHFCNYIDVYTLFAPNSSFYPFPATSPLPLVLATLHPQAESVLPSCSAIL